MPSRGVPLVRFVMDLYEEGLREARQHDRQITELRRSALRLAKSPRAATRSNALDALKGVIAKIERSQTNSKNRRGKVGRKPREEWGLRCGMDPVDALLIPVLLERLGKPLRPATYDRLLASHAIERAGDSLANTRLDVCLKSLREAPPAEIKRVLRERVAKLPAGASGLRFQLKEIRTRVYHGE